MCARCKERFRPKDLLERQCFDCRGSGKSTAGLERIRSNRAEDIPSFLAGVGVPARFQRWRTRAEWCERFDSAWPVQLSTDPWLGRPEMVYVHGPTGTGKTGLGTLLLLERGLAGLGCRWIAAADVLAGLQQEFNEPGPRSLSQSLRAVTVLVIDGLWDGKGVAGDRPSEWQLEALSGLLDARWRDMRETIVTSNWTPLQIGALAPALASRLVDPDGGELVQLGGADRRIMARRQRRAE
jgi:hypothetical protein